MFLAYKYGEHFPNKRRIQLLGFKPIPVRFLYGARVYNISNPGPDEWLNRRRSKR